MTAERLKKRIDDLFDALGASDKPATAEIRSELSQCSIMAETLDEGDALRDSEAKIAVLKEALAEADAAFKQSEACLEQANIQNGYLETNLQTLRAEIEQLRKEQATQKEGDKTEALSGIERNILYFLDRDGEAFEWQIAEYTEKRAGTLEGILERMTGDGLLDFRGDENFPPIYFLTKKAKKWLAADRQRQP